MPSGILPMLCSVGEMMVVVRERERELGVVEGGDGANCAIARIMVDRKAPIGLSIS